MEYTSIKQIKEANKNCGGHFFDPETMRAFNSQILAGVYGGHYFLTSEGEQARMWTVRYIDDNGSIRTPYVPGETMHHDSFESAKWHAIGLAAKEVGNG